MSLEIISNRFKELEAQYAGKDIPCPPHWGGFIIVPESIEFWYGRHGRMHERYLYTRNGSNWDRSFLNP